MIKIEFSVCPLLYFALTLADTILVRGRVGDWGHEVAWGEEIRIQLDHQPSGTKNGTDAPTSSGVSAQTQETVSAFSYDFTYRA